MIVHAPLWVWQRRLVDTRVTNESVNWFRHAKLVEIVAKLSHRVKRVEFAVHWCKVLHVETIDVGDNLHLIQAIQRTNKKPGGKPQKGVRMYRLQAISNDTMPKDVRKRTRALLQSHDNLPFAAAPAQFCDPNRTKLPSTRQALPVGGSEVRDKKQRLSASILLEHRVVTAHSIDAGTYSCRQSVP
jgi:hypothetical protein